MAQTMTGVRRTEKQLKYFKARADGTTQREAARQAGYCVNGGTIQSLEKCMASYMKDVMEQGGITPELLASKLREGLEATTVRAFKSKGENGDEIIDKAYPDYETRLKYVDLSSTLLGLYPNAKSVDNTPQGNSVNIFQISQDLAHLSESELREQMQRRVVGIMSSAKQVSPMRLSPPLGNEEPEHK